MRASKHADKLSVLFNIDLTADSVISGKIINELEDKPVAYYTIQENLIAISTSSGTVVESLNVDNLPYLTDVNKLEEPDIIIKVAKVIPKKELCRLEAIKLQKAKK